MTEHVIEKPELDDAEGFTLRSESHWIKVSRWSDGSFVAALGLTGVARAYKVWNCVARFRPTVKGSKNPRTVGNRAALLKSAEDVLRGLP